MESTYTIRNRENEKIDIPKDDSRTLLQIISGFFLWTEMILTWLMFGIPLKVSFSQTIPTIRICFKLQIFGIIICPDNLPMQIKSLGTFHIIKRRNNFVPSNHFWCLVSIELLKWRLWWIMLQPTPELRPELRMSRNFSSLSQFWPLLPFTVAHCSKHSVHSQYQALTWLCLFHKLTLKNGDALS